LHALLVGLLIWTAIYIVAILPRFVVRMHAAVALLTFEAGFFLIALILLHRGALRNAALIYLLGIGIPSTILIAFHLGIRSPVLVLYISIPISAAWLLGYRAAVIGCVVCLATALLMAVLETVGYTLPRYFTAGAPLSLWALFLQATIIAAVPVMVVLRTLNKALETAQRSIRELGDAQAALRRERDLTVNVMETSPVGILALNREGRITFANSNAEMILGSERDKILRSYLDQEWQITRPDGTPLMPEEAPYNVFRKGGEPRYGVRCAVVRPDGGCVQLSLNAAPLSDESGHFNGGVLAFEDITAQARIDQELQRHREHLEELVLQRTQELEIARDQAMAASQAKSAFLASISHELRTPLNAILGFSRLILDGHGRSTDYLAKVRIIVRSGEHLLDLINDVLDMAKIEAGRVSIDIAPTDLNDLVAGVTDMMRVRAEEKHLIFIVDRAPSFPAFVRTDAPKLRQILINLLGNAISYTEHGHVVLRLTAETEGQLRLVLEVADTGVGIAAADQERIFQPFVRLRQQAAGGTGLGLAITRQYVRSMGGTISVESASGMGSRFRVSLPVQAVETSEAQLPRSEHNDVIGLVSGQPPYRILIVEDHKESSLLLCSLLVSVGFEVKVAEDGAEGIALFQSWHPHFIWMDWQLPVMSGEDATRAIRTMEGGQDVKIAAVTASVLAEERADILAAGVDDLVAKPFRPAAIFDCMAWHLGVRYVYGSSKVLSDVSNAATLSAEALRALPEELRQQLADALVRLDIAEVNRLIRQIGTVDSASGAVLSRHADRLAFTQMLKVVQEAATSAKEAT
jgi:PAS domain S-box-containing protein